jgi:hypothetical protein
MDSTDFPEVKILSNKYLFSKVICLVIVYHGNRLLEYWGDVRVETIEFLYLNVIDIWWFSQYLTDTPHFSFQGRSEFGPRL